MLIFFSLLLCGEMARMNAYNYHLVFVELLVFDREYKIFFKIFQSSGFLRKPAGRGEGIVDGPGGEFTFMRFLGTRVPHCLSKFGCPVLDKFELIRFFDVGSRYIVVMGL